MSISWSEFPESDFCEVTSKMCWYCQVIQSSTPQLIGIRKEVIKCQAPLQGTLRPLWFLLNVDLKNGPLSFLDFFPFVPQ